MHIERKIIMKNVTETMENMENMVSNSFEESSKTIVIFPVLSTAISLAVVAIPVVAGILYIKDRKKIMNADTSSAFMNMGNGNF